MKRVKNEIEHFSKLEHIWWGAKTYAGQRRYDDKLVKFKNYCNPQKGVRVLEIGCGDGEFSKRLVRLPIEVLGIDITPHVINKAKKIYKGKKNIRFKIDNAEKLSLKSNTFNIVCGISILQHVNYERCLKETYRVLKDGGQIFFTEPNIYNPIIYLGLKIPFLRKKMEYSPDEVALVRWKMESLLKSIGFKEVVVVNYDFLFPKTPRRFVKRVQKISKYLEKIFLVNNLSGSLIIWARK